MRPGGYKAAVWGAALGVTASASSAWADVPVDGAIGMPAAATAIAEEIHSFHNFLLPIIVAISVLVLVLLVWVMIRYNRRVNPTPKKFTHNMTVEVIWTIVPVLILVAIAWRSFPLLFHEEQIPPAEVTLKVTGNSWFWSYEYPDYDVSIVSNLLPEEEAQATGQPWLLATNNPLYVPVGENVRVLVTSNDVIHSFAVPQFGVKEDAIQGRVNETWFNIEREGVYYGQCSELCGQDHAFMPIEIHAVSRAEFEQWVAAQGGSVASAEPEAAPAEPGARAEAPAR